MVQACVETMQATVHADLTRAQTVTFSCSHTQLQRALCSLAKHCDLHSGAPCSPCRVLRAI